MGVNLDSVLVRESEPTSAVVDDDIVLLSLRAGAYFGLNRVGSEIWAMLEEPCSTARIFEALAQTHDVDAVTLARDVTPFLEALVEQRLVRVITPGDRP